MALADYNHSLGDTTGLPAAEQEYSGWQSAPLDPSSLPPGFLQSEYGPAWQSVYDQYKGTGDQSLLRWLNIAPLAFQRGESLAGFTGPTSSGQIGGLDPATIGQLALGGFGGAAFGSGVGATEGGVGAGTGATGIGEGSSSTAATGVAPSATQGVVGGSTTGIDVGIGGGGGGGSVSTGLEGSGAGSGVNATTGATEIGGTSSGPGTAMSRILDGTATTADWLSVGGNLAGTGLGIAGARNQANAFNNLASQYMAFGAPSRARYEASMTPGFDPNSIPGYSGAVDTASKGILARLSATGGNPYGNPGGLIEANKQIISGTALPAIDAYQRLNAGTGGYAGFNAAAPGAATAGIGANAGVYNAIGSGLAGLTNPQPSIYDTLARLGVQGLS